MCTVKTGLTVADLGTSVEDSLIYAHCVASLARDSKLPLCRAEDC